MLEDGTLKLPIDAWIAVHRDLTLCTNTTIGSAVLSSAPLIVFRDKKPVRQAECAGDGEVLSWARVTIGPQSAAVRLGGTARMIDPIEDDEEEA